MVGKTVSHYKILEKLGEGGMGVVYRAEDLTLKRTVALKFLPPTLTGDPEAKERFIHEARAASALDHPNICTIHEIGQTDDGQLFIVMACYDGETLKKKLEQGPIPIDQAVDITLQVASGLARAHEAGIVHRDIKPANIMLTTRNEAKILDFGLAKLGGGSVLTRTGTTLGTAAYMSPEQARGEEVDQRTDIWSLGVVLYEMLAGQRPFQNDYEQALVYAILNEQPKPLRHIRPETPEVVEQIVTKALAKNLQDRYQTAEEFLADLKIARGEEEQGGTIAAAETMERRRRKKLVRRLIVGGVTVVVVAIGVLIVIPLMQDQAIASNPKALAFISFENNTGDGSLAYLQNVLPRALSTGLEESKYLRVTRSDRMRELMKQIDKDTMVFIDKETGLLLCRRARVDVMVAGSYTKAGPLFLTELELIDVNTGMRIGSLLKARGREVESFLQEDGIVDDLARQISRGMGVSRLTTQTSLKPVAQVGSGSLKAQQYYQRAKQEVERYDFKESRHFLELALSADSTFAIAWQLLGFVCGQMADGPAAHDAYEHAKRNVSRATEREQFVIAEGDSSIRTSLLKSRGRAEDGKGYRSFVKARAEIFPFDAEFRSSYAFSLVDGHTEQAIPEFERALELDPAQPDAYNALGFAYSLSCRFDKAIQMLERYAELLPGEPNPVHSMAEVLMSAGRYSDAIAKCEEVLRMKPDFGAAAFTLTKLHFLNENYDETIRWCERATELSPSPLMRAYSTWWRAYYLVWAGRLKEAEGSLEKAEHGVEPKYDHAWAVLARVSWLRGWCAYERGEWGNARRHLLRYARLSHSTYTYRPWYSEFCLALVDLQEGRMDSIDMRLKRMRDTLQAKSRRYPTIAYFDKSWRYYGSALKGALLLATHRPAAIQPSWIPHLTTAFGGPELDSLTTASWPIANAWGLTETWDLSWIPIPFDILPRAYVERNMIDSAIASYERALERPPNELGPIIPRYYYRLARLYEQKGMKEKAIENYAQFLRVWGKADPFYKEPADARARLARLKRG
jgi:eukaryotic-like serine/threonine-protein kinase